MANIKQQLNVLIVLGITEKTEEKRISPRIQLISHLDAQQMQEAIVNSTIVVSRSGYSTIMDLAVLHKKCIFIPTPGQTEQEYLATYSEKKIAYAVAQKGFDLGKALQEGHRYKGFTKSYINEGFKKRVKMLDKIIENKLKVKS